MNNMSTSSSLLIPTGRDWVALQSEIVLTVAVIGILVWPVITGRRSGRVSGLIAGTGVVVAYGLTWIRSIDPGYVFRGLLVNDPAAVFWEQILMLFMVGVVGLWFLVTRRHVKPGDSPEFFTLLLISTIGMMLMGQTTHLLMAVLVMEIASMPSYILAGFRKDRRVSAEASLKFVLFGAVCSAVMIYGMSLLYGVYQSLDISVIAQMIQTRGEVELAGIFGFLAVFVGLLFKISGFPFHFWTPDVLEGTTADVAVFLSVASKSAGIILLARFATLLGPCNEVLMSGMAITVGIVSVVTMVIGNLGALQQTSVKRLLAYSSIAHAGYILSAVAVVMPTAIDQAMTVLGIYLAIYLFMQLGAFAAVAEVEDRHGNDHLTSFQGWSMQSPFSAAGLAVAMISMIGLPPFGGFWAKMLVMVLCAHQGGWWWVITASIAVNSVISVGFYGRVLRAMYLQKSTGPVFGIPKTTGLIPILCAIGLVISFVALSPLQQTAQRMSQQFRTLPSR
jgi:NADH-quinone oxidoreductase subunit N